MKVMEMEVKIFPHLVIIGNVEFDIDWDISHKYRIAEVLSVVFNPHKYYDNKSDSELIEDGEKKKVWEVKGERERDLRKLIRLINKKEYSSVEYQKLLLEYGQWTVMLLKDEIYVLTDQQGVKWILTRLLQDDSTYLYNSGIREEFYRRLMNREYCDDLKPESIAELFAPVYYRLLKDPKKYIIDNFFTVFQKEYGFVMKDYSVKDEGKKNLVLRMMTYPLLYLKEDMRKLYITELTGFVMAMLLEEDDEILKKASEIFFLQIR